MDYCEKEGLRNTDKEECLNSCNVEGDENIGFDIFNMLDILNLNI